MTTAAFKPIETRYAGCRFRSRLEARWAVFFTTLGVEWQYEPEGYEIGIGGGRTRHYLPDFYLPQHGIWVEVKGRIDSADLTLLSACCVDPWSGPILPDIKVNARYDGRDDYDGTNPGLVIVGDIPPPPVPGDFATHAMFQWSKGARCLPVQFSTRGLGPDGRGRPGAELVDVVPEDASGERFLVPKHIHHYDTSTLSGAPGERLNCLDHLNRRCELKPYTVRNIKAINRHGTVIALPDPAVLAAYAAARSARFEHGEKG